jgi:hypothetical protein
MIILIDACFWSHSKQLFDANILDIRKYILAFRWGYTLAVQQEIEHFELDDFIRADNAIMFPVSASERQHTFKLAPSITELDDADQELIIACRRERGLILSDDGEFLMECAALGLPTISLPVFLLKLVENGDMDKRTVSRCLKFWEENHRFKLKQLAWWKKELQSIQ